MGRVPWNRLAKINWESLPVPNVNMWSWIQRGVMSAFPLVLIALLVSCWTGTIAADEPSAAAKSKVKATAEQLDFFRQQVKPILEMRCLKCHGGETEIRGKL